MVEQNVDKDAEVMNVAEIAHKQESKQDEHQYRSLDDITNN